MTLPGIREAVGVVLAEHGASDLASRLEEADPISLDQRTVLAEEIERWS